jgi:hypothetical protein
MAINTTSTAPSTLLDAINTLLEAARVAGIDSLAQVDLNEDAGQAKRDIDTLSRQTQMSGWEFNNRRMVTLDPEVDGSILLPLNVVKCKTNRLWTGNQLVVRGRKLFDKVAGTYTIGTSVLVDYTEILEFADLPESMRAYITGLAARRFALPRLPSATNFKYTEELVTSFLAMAQQEDADAEDLPMNQTNPHFARMGRR